VPPQTQYVPEAGTIEAHVPIVDPATRGLKGAVVSVEGPEGPAPAGPPRVHALDQVRFTFVPHVLAVRSGDEVRFMSSDDANHNVRSADPRNAFNVVTVRGVDANRAFRPTAGGGPAELRCDIHGWMKAWVYVFEHPWFAVTDADGRFRIEGVPPGERTLRVRHADGGLEARVLVQVRPGEAAEAVVEVGGEGAPGAAR
jgi:plastocyanin